MFQLVMYYGHIDKHVESNIYSNTVVPRNSGMSICKRILSVIDRFPLIRGVYL